MRNTSSKLGIQLTGRFSWNDELTQSARRYTREPSEENLQALENARDREARELIRLQSGLKMEFVTDGGVGQFDLFSPFLDGVEGIEGGGNIDRYPGTRNSYYHIPKVSRRIKVGHVLPPGIMPRSGFLASSIAKVILPSPAAFALACENQYYSDRVQIVEDFSLILKDIVKELSNKGVVFVQLTDCFLPCSRFKTRVSEEMVKSLRDALDVIFDGFKGRSAIYFHSGDCSSFLSLVKDSAVTDLGFDFNTPIESLKGMNIDKNLLLGFQNTTRKLPDNLMGNEPALLAQRAKGAVARIGVPSNSLVYLCPSQDYDGLQTYRDAVSRLNNLGRAVLESGVYN